MSTNRNVKIPSLCLELLSNRGIKGDTEIAEFLFPKLKNLPPPERMKGLVEAAELIRFYIENDLQIVIWGDYDVDGTTATGLLVNFFNQLGVPVVYHIPNRLTEGYGLNLHWFKDATQDFKSKKFLLITVDCGISNSREIAKLKERGADVIVTDHHSIPPEGIPDCVVVNPSQADCGFHQEKLAGVGVAFYLAAAVRATLIQLKRYKELCGSINLKEYLAFTALGTVADLVEITATNRILVRAGMESLKTTNFPGLKALLGSCGLYGQDISSEDIGYILGPKVNAAGRLGKSGTAIDLFLAAEESEAKRLAEKLERLNEKRKSICENDFDQALYETEREKVTTEFLSVSSGEYHLGVAGIVASRMVEELKVPSVVFAEFNLDSGEAILKGSIRSVEGISVIEALNNSSQYIEKYGGHEMAAGLTVKVEHLEQFSMAFSQDLKRQKVSLGKTHIKPKATETTVDAVMDQNTLEYLTKFEPFGPGNEAPIFIDRTTQIIQAKTVGKLNTHLNLIVRGEYSNYKGIGFNLGDRISAVQEHPERTLYFTPTKNRYRGTVSWQLRVIDLQ